MTTLALTPLASWLLVGTIWIALSLGVWFFLLRPSARRAETEERADRAELDGSLTQLVEHNRKRMQRAAFRQATKHSREFEDAA